MTCECGQDFFIYVPKVNDVETLSHTSNVGNDKIDSRLVDPAVNIMDESWVKIPLEGSVVVYARLRDKLEII